jgi:hypothetical protein
MGAGCAAHLQVIKSTLLYPLEEYNHILHSPKIGIIPFYHLKMGAEPASEMSWLRFNIPHDQFSPEKQHSV